MSEAIERQQLEAAWERLRTHLEWAEEFWLAFVFTDDPRVLAALRERTAAHLEPGGLRTWSCPAPTKLDAMVADIVGAELGQVNWIDLLRFDDYQGQPGWGAAWERLMLRLNERRELLRRRAPGGGFIFATTLDRLDTTPAAAPDLWTIRSLVLCVEGLPRASGWGPILAPLTSNGALRSVHRDLRLARQAVDAARASQDQPRLARTLSALAYATTEEEAVSVRREALALYRELVEADPALELRRALAAELNTLSNELAVLGRHELALDAAHESVAQARALAAAAPDPGLCDLATSLNNLGTTLYSLGRPAEAVEVSREAVEIRRRLAATRSEAALANLAGSLTNLGAQLGELGLSGEALASTREAATLFRELAESEPGTYLPKFAVALSNLGPALASMGDAEALAAQQEAVWILRELTTANPDDFLSTLALSLHNLGTLFGKFSRTKDALAATREAMELRRQLAESRPEVFLPELATSLSNLAIWLVNLERPQEALERSQEALDIHRELAQTQPTSLEHARSLGVHGLALLAAGEPGRASDHFEEALRADLELRSTQRGALVEAMLEELGHDYQRACFESGTPPAEDLLAQLAALD